jgi:glycosyl transferase, family 25
MKTYVIYLRDNEFSVKMATEAGESLDRFGIKYELFDGVIGASGKNVLRSYGVKPSAYVKQDTWSDGTIGCLASHYLLWDMCANQTEPYMILEQDAVVVRDPRELLDQIEKVCHLDAALPFSSQEDSQAHFAYYNDSMQNYQPGVHKHPSNTFYSNKQITGNTFRGAYAYILTPEGARDILSFINKKGAFPADVCLCESATYLQRANSTYVRLNPFFDRLATQREFSMRK